MRDIESIDAGLECRRCGYDLRAQGEEGKCPECGELVAESRRWAAVPRRPVWGESDARWRRRIVAGVWVLVLVPLMAVFEASGWGARLVVPTPFDFKGDVMLNETYAVGTYSYLAFCIGMVLLFSKERGRRAGRLDWTRRWGVMGSYGVFLLGIPHFAFITALVAIGIGALFLSMPLRNQPAVTGMFVKLGTGYLYHGPHPSVLSAASLCVFSSVVVMLACVPLYNALRSNGPKKVAMLLLAPLVLADLVQLGDIVQYSMGFFSVNMRESYYPFYFNADLLVKEFPATSFRYIMEAGKWLACLVIAVWLSVAQIMAWKWGRGNRISG